MFVQFWIGVLIITSYVGHDEVRSAHRQAITEEKLQSLGILRVFLLAEIPTTEKFIIQKSIENESNRFHDIVQGNFQEAYRNLSYKHIMGLRWAAAECQRAKFIIKVDDDTVFDIYFIRNYLDSVLQEHTYDANTELETFLAGFVLDSKKPIRNVANKWYVSLEEYRPSIYPDYLSGWLYITTPKTAKLLVLESQHEPFMWIDDTWITGVLRERIDIQLISLNKWFSANSQFLDCCLDDLIKHSLKCDYQVGPNGGDVKLITNFLKALEKCYEADDEVNGCNERTPDKLVTRTCVGKTKDIIGQHGNALVKQIRL